MTDRKPHEKLVELRKRLKGGKLTEVDVRSLEKIVLDAESAVKNLRAAVVE